MTGWGFKSILFKETNMTITSLEGLFKSQHKVETLTQGNKHMTHTEE